ncbi:MAG: nucleoside hydrolase [Pseudomonadota bacterium]
MSPRRVILDCDPGVDDAVSLLAALASPDELDILGITTVAGNTPVDVCTRNALRVLALANRQDVDVYPGCDRPLVEAALTASHVHGDDGLGGAPFPEPGQSASDKNAVDFIIETLRAHEERDVTLVPTGPLTNIATALTKAPDIAERITEIVLMGGAYFEGGNVTPSAEFNIYADPHAAQIVFGCGRPITAFGLDVTLQFRCTPARMKVFQAMGTPVGAAATAMIDHVNAVYGELYGSEGAAMHDPCTVLYLLKPDLFRFRDAFILHSPAGPLRHARRPPCARA